MAGNEQYEFFNKVILRTPFYSFEDFALEKMPEVLGREDFRNAIWLASMDFYRVLEKKAFDWALLDERQRFTLYKYYNRMSFRPTPFGSFAGFTLVDWAAGSGVTLGEQGAARLHVLPSLRFRASALAGDLSGVEDPLLFTNPLLYKLGGTWRFIRSGMDATGKLVFTMDGIAGGRINNFLVRRAGQMPVRKRILEKELSEKADCTPEDAAGYIGFLVSEQVLFSEDRPGLLEKAGGDVASFFLLSAIGELPRQAACLALTGYPAGRMEVGQPFYTALERPRIKGGMDVMVQDELCSALDMLRKIALPGNTGALDEFREGFKAKFEGRKVPLLLALDPDAGLGYGGLYHDVADGGLLQGVGFPETEAKKAAAPWTPVHRLFLKVWLENSTRNIFDPVAISDDDLAGLQDRDGVLPPGMAMLFSRAGGKLVLESAGGATAAALIARFSPFSEEVGQLCREIADAEAAANPGIVFAEIHQLSHELVDNVSRRCRIYDYVIPLNTFPQDDEGIAIMPGDLLLSVAGDELLLESGSLRKRVIPRLPSAYNFRNNDMALFRFLCDLQYQGLAGLTFDPEQLFPGMPFYPRIAYRDTVVSLAKWIIGPEDVSMLIACPVSISRLHLYRQQRGIPRHIALGSGDQRLVFDLGKDGEALFFLASLKGAGAVVLREFLLPGNVVISEGAGYAAQAVALLRRGDQVYKVLHESKKVRKTRVKRSFLPGSEWLYFKFYCRAESAGRVLRHVVAPVLEAYKKEILCWYFIRYHDPAAHLRVRVRASEEHIPALMAAFGLELAKVANEGLVGDYRTDTYHRELERYSPEMIEMVEDVFCSGSEWVMGLLAAGEKPVGESLAPLVLVYAWCSVFIGDPGQMVAFLGRMKAHYFREFKGEGKLKFSMDQKYREISREMLRAVAPGNGEADTGDWGLESSLKKIGAIRDAVSGWPPEKREKMLADLVHMQVNRCYDANQRRYEGVIYYCLHKLAVSALARPGHQGVPFR
jgi:thiopeptide-type bacteriocin biosynthesis protein